MKINTTINKETVTIYKFEGTKELVKAIKNNKYLSDVVIDFANTVIRQNNIHRVILEKDVLRIDASVWNDQVVLFCVTFKHIDFYEVNFTLEYNKEEETWNFDDKAYNFVNEYNFKVK